MSTAHELMREHHIRHLPVLRAGELVGVVSIGDLHFLETLKDVNPEEVTVEDAMTGEPYTVSPDERLEVVAATMAEHKLGCAVVVEEKRVVGVFTSVDALRALADVLRRGHR